MLTGNTRVKTGSIRTTSPTGVIERLDSEKVLENGLNFAQMPMGTPIIRQENGKWGWFLMKKVPPPMSAT